jgi:hypothetical protein
MRQGKHCVASESTTMARKEGIKETQDKAGKRVVSKCI